MTKEDEDNLLRWLQDKDISEVMDLLMKHCNRYSRRILKFFRWFCKYVPITLMLFHAYVIPRLWNVGFLAASTRHVHPIRRKYALLSLHIFHGIHSTYGSYSGKPIFLLVLEIPHSLLLLCKHQCCSHR